MAYLLGMVTDQERHVLLQRGWTLQPVSPAVVQALDENGQDQDPGILNELATTGDLWVKIWVDNDLTRPDGKGLMDNPNAWEMEPYPRGMALLNKKPALSNDFEDGEDHVIPVGTPCVVSQKRPATEGDYVIFEVTFEGGGSVFCTKEELDADFTIRAVYDHYR